MSFQDEIKKLRELAIINEDVKKVLERMTGKELVSYEGIDALVGALMAHYNGELKNKAQASHSHSWGSIAGRPSAFPPASHTHPYLSTSGGTINGALTVTGQIVSNGDVTAFSDRDLKENIKPLEDNLLDRLQVYSYNYKDKSDTRYGVIAQDLQEIYPNLVVETDTEVNGRKALAVRDRDVIYLLVDSYKKLLKRVEELERK